MNLALLSKGLGMTAQEPGSLGLELPPTIPLATPTAAFEIEITKPAYTLAEVVS
jgi:hypothetical protein